MASLNAVDMSGDPKPASRMDGGILGIQARAQYGRWPLCAGISSGTACVRGWAPSNWARARSLTSSMPCSVWAWRRRRPCGLRLGLWKRLAVCSRPILAVFLFWQMIPIMMASFQEQFDLSILLRFPVAFGSYFLLFIVFGLADSSTILGGLCCVGLGLVSPSHVRSSLVGQRSGWRFLRLQHSAYKGHLCLDRPLAGPAQDARDSGRSLHGGDIEPSTGSIRRCTAEISCPEMPPRSR